MTRTVGPFKIPNSGIGVLSKVASLAKPKRALLVEAFMRPITAATELRIAVTDCGAGLDSEDATNLIGNLIGITTLASSHDYDLEEVAKRASESKQLNLTDSKRKILAELLTTLLRAQSIRGISKASDIASEHDKHLHDVRIVTDIRPVFDDDPSSPIGALIENTLRLSYLCDGKYQTSEFVLPKGFDHEIRNALERAEAKLNSITAMLEEAKIPIYSLEDEG